MTTQLILLSSNKTPLEVQEAVQGAWNKLRKATICHNRELKDQPLSSASGVAVNEPHTDRPAVPVQSNRPRLPGGGKKVPSRLMGRSGVSASPAADSTRSFSNGHTQPTVGTPRGSFTQLQDSPQDFRGLDTAAVEADLCGSPEKRATSQLAPGFMNTLTMNSSFRTNLHSPALLPAATAPLVGASHWAPEKGYSGARALAPEPRAVRAEVVHGSCKSRSRNCRASANGACVPGPASGQPSSNEANWRAQANKEKGLLHLDRMQKNSPKPAGHFLLQHRQLLKQQRGIVASRRSHVSRGLARSASPRSTVSADASGSTHDSAAVFSAGRQHGGTGRLVKGTRQMRTSSEVGSVRSFGDETPHVTISPPGACVPEEDSELLEGNCGTESARFQGLFQATIVSGFSRNERAGPPSTLGDCDSTEVGPSEQGRSEALCPSLSPSAETLSSGCYGPSVRNSLSRSPGKNRSTSRDCLTGLLDLSQTALPPAGGRVVGLNEGEGDCATAGCASAHRETRAHPWTPKKQEGYSAERCRAEPWPQEARRHPPRSPKQRVSGAGSAHVLLYTMGRGHSRKQREDRHYQEGAHRSPGFTARKNRHQHQRVKRESQGTLPMSRRGAEPSGSHSSNTWRQTSCSDLHVLPNALLVSPCNVSNNVDRPLTGCTFVRQQISSSVDDPGTGCVLPPDPPPETCMRMHQSYPGTPNSVMNPLASSDPDHHSATVGDLQEVHLPPAAFYPSSSFLYPKHGDTDAAPVVVMPSTIRQHNAVGRLQSSQQHAVPHFFWAERASLTERNEPAQQEMVPRTPAYCPGNTATTGCGSSPKYSSTQKFQSNCAPPATATGNMNGNISEAEGEHEVGFPRLWIRAPEGVSSAGCLGPAGNFTVGVEPYSAVEGTKGPAAEDTDRRQEASTLPGFSIGCDFAGFLPVSALAGNHPEVGCPSQLFDGRFIWSWINYHDMIRYFCIQMGQEGTTDLLIGAAARADYAD